MIAFIGQPFWSTDLSEESLEIVMQGSIRTPSEVMSVVTRSIGDELISCADNIVAENPRPAEKDEQ